MKKKESVLGRGLSSILNDPSNNSLKISEKSNPNYSKIYIIFMTKLIWKNHLSKLQIYTPLQQIKVN